MNLDTHTLPPDANPAAPHAVPAADTAAAAAPITPGGGRPLTRTHLVTSLAFAAIVSLDLLYPEMRIRGSWWLVLLLVWLMPWPNRRFDATRSLRLDGDAVLQLVTLAVLGWLYASAWVALTDSLLYWQFTDPEHPLRRLAYPLQTALTGMAIAALLAKPLHRAFGAQAAAAALVIAAPIVALTCLESLSDVTRWTDRPLSNAIQTFDAVFPLLLLLQAIAWLEHRSPAAAAHAETHRTLGDRLAACSIVFRAGSRLRPLLHCWY